MTYKSPQILSLVFVCLLGLGCRPPTQAMCSPTTCAGCCAPDGSCDTGTSGLQCGTDGELCEQCVDELSCLGSQCVPSDCGNGTRGPGEACDLGDLGSSTCESLGLSMGTLACTPTCDFDLSGCSGACSSATCAGCCGDDGRCYPGASASRCGSDAAACRVCEAGEACEGGDCVLIGCGNGVREESEECDATDSGSATCESLGFEGGSIRCTVMCTHDITDCTGNPCIYDETHDRDCNFCRGSTMFQCAWCAPGVSDYSFDCDSDGLECADEDDGVTPVLGALCRAPGTERCDADTFSTTCTSSTTRAECFGGGVMQTSCTSGLRRDAWVCEGEGHCVDSRREACVEDTFEAHCSAGDVVWCGSGGYTQFSDCDSDEVCSTSGVPFPQCTLAELGACTHGDGACDSNRYYWCSNGVWTRRADCAEYPEEICNPASGCS